MFSSPRPRRSRASARGSRRASIPSTSSIRAGCTATSEIGWRRHGAGGARFWLMRPAVLLAGCLLGCQQPQPDAIEVERSRSYQQDKADGVEQDPAVPAGQRHHGPAERLRDAARSRRDARNYQDAGWAECELGHRHRPEQRHARPRRARQRAGSRASRSGIDGARGRRRDAGDARCDRSPSGRSIPGETCPSTRAASPRACSRRRCSTRSERRPPALPGECRRRDLRPCRQQAGFAR